MKAGAMMQSKFLKKDDINMETGNLVTIDELTQQNVAQNDAEEEMKWCVQFKEFKVPMVLNSTNIQLITKALGTDETDEWLGKKVVVYFDENVSFAGKLTGGLRIRKSKAPQATGQASVQAQARSFADEMNSTGPVF